MLSDMIDEFAKK